ncbi:MAG: UDP-4-amino-4-deoxy-L-arabinose-oxoglutarate aminotransferase [Candidatus Pelagibacter sp. TMED128]|nr:MAG: UDP-4-amino-4-deoxy-L-arabinose-oxoglutarate aminotransferase [Candidatus Pelagibacter sp. TMED128]|tara:strand:- start:1523 stop:2671 length:1149 start_codon:yes stop_codon:yes gene_type:complete
MKNLKVRLSTPTVNYKELNKIKAIFKNSWLGYGPNVEKFENLWSKYFNVKHSVGLNSCTAALHLSLAVNNFKKNKKVLVPAMTFSASAASILYCGLKPIFVDIDPKTLVLSFDDLKKKYTKDCVAIIAVHFNGQPCEMEKIVPWAKKKKMIVIEDCAQTCGGDYKGKKLGTWGDFGCFSFQEIKIMTSGGDGGMITTNNTKLIKDLKTLSYHGWDQDPLARHKKSLKGNKKIKHWNYSITKLGFKYNMTDLMASIGMAQLKKLSFFNNRRSNIIKSYVKSLKDCKKIKAAFPYEFKKSSFWMFSIRCKKRDLLIDFLKSKKIATTVYIKPLPLHPLYKKFKSKIPNSLKIWKELVTVPTYPNMTKSQLRYVIKSLKEFDRSL